MNDATKAVFVILGLMVTAGLIFWAYEYFGSSAPDYSRAFDQDYRGEKAKDPEPDYHGTKEKDIRKWRGDRYSTY